jgi:L-ascorbate metabolism protein UlaG (beta-lactamase superfamily)
MLTVVTDPYEPGSGEDPLKLKADVITISREEPGHNYVNAVVGAQRGDVRALRGPGEYEMGGVFITGVAMRADHDAATARSTVYSFYYDGLNVVHLGGLPFVPTQAQIDALETIDVLLLPVGSGDGLSAVQASEIISLVEPSIVVPVHYKTPGLAASQKLDGVGKFLKEMGLSEAKAQESLKITKGSLPEDTQVVLLEIKR